MMRPGVPTTTCAPRLQRVQLRRVALAAVDRQHVEARHVRRRSSGTPRRPGSPVRGSAPSPAPAARAGRGRSCDRIGSAKRRSCRCRSAPGRAGRWPASSTGMRRGLDRRGRFVADVGQGREHGRRQPQVGERAGNFGLGGRHGRSLGDKSGAESSPAPKAAYGPVGGRRSTPPLTPRDGACGHTINGLAEILWPAGAPSRSLGRSSCG